MRVFAWLCFFCAMLPVGIAAETPSLTDIVATLPPCALSCLTTALANSTCSPTDQQCICTNVPLNTQVNECVLSHCTIKETLTTKNATSVACNVPVRDRRNLYNWASNSFVILSWVAYLLRMATRFAFDTQFWWDDYAATIFMGLGLPSAVINVQGLTRNGLGKDIWTLSFKNISDMIRFFYAAEILYFAQISFIKVSILLFFLRLFPDRKIRYIIWGTIMANIMILAIFDALAAFQCRPVSFYWKRWDNEHDGQCLNINALAFTSAGVSIVMDIWMLILPLTQLYNLKLHWKKKLGVASMLGIGILVTIVSILRLKSIVLFSNTTNPTWDYVQVGYWSTIEICVGIVCSSMPALRLLLVRLFPRMAGTTTNSSLGSKSLGHDPNRRRSSVPRLSRSARRGSDPYPGSYGGISTTKTFDVVSNPRRMEMGMGFDKHTEEGEDDGTELVGRSHARTETGTGTDVSVEAHAADTSHTSHTLGDDSARDLEHKRSMRSMRSMNEGVLMTPRSPGWV